MKPLLLDHIHGTLVKIKRTNKHMKQYSASFVICKMHYIAIITITDNTKYSLRMGRNWNTAGGNMKWCNHYGKQFVSFLKAEHEFTTPSKSIP